MTVGGLERGARGCNAWDGQGPTRRRSGRLCGWIRGRGNRSARRRRSGRDCALYAERQCFAKRRSVDIASSLHSICGRRRHRDCRSRRRVDSARAVCERRGRSSVNGKMAPIPRARRLCRLSLPSMTIALASALFRASASRLDYQHIELLTVGEPTRDVNSPSGSGVASRRIVKARSIERWT
jgi:hypothetical protein